MQAQDAWQAFKDARDAMISARMDLVATDWEPVVERALQTGDAIPTAVALLRSLPAERTERFGPALLPLTLHTTGQLQAIRDLLRSLGPGWMSAHGRDFVESTIASPDATYEDFRRVAELLRDLGEPELLAHVVDVARGSDDPDIAEVAEDFG